MMHAILIGLSLWFTFDIAVVVLLLTRGPASVRQELPDYLRRAL